jgi:precorrin-2 dehydrogenase / sirohydrochlorin ferrochelatase
MLSLSLDLTRLRLALIGNGAAAARRLAWLDEAGAASATVFAAAPSPELVEIAGARLTPHWPESGELAGFQLVFIADLPEAQRSALAAAARAAGAIVHVEDVPSLCDAHAPAVLRRGDLTIAISTNGTAPGLAAELKHFLGGIFGPEWRGRLDELKTLRQRWRQAGAGHDTVRHLTAARLSRHGWLKKSRGAAANDPGKAITDRGGGSCR